jgi:23S rRNA (adenine2030-N6)-methyltransferase
VRPSSRYRSEATPDYTHRHHAGNVGDVWKHLVLIEVLRRVAALGRVEYVESHAGEGAYRLGATGEWTEGIGRLRDAGHDGGALASYLSLCGDPAARCEYPGSPALARAVLGPKARLSLWERDERAATVLRASVAQPAEVLCADGLPDLADAVRAAEARADAVVVLVDPPWGQKADWVEVPDALAAAVRVSRRATFLLWYPVKSLTRPNAMAARLRRAGVSAQVAELITTPLEQQRRRLNGSAVLLVRPPAGTLAAVAAAAPEVAARCATETGTWAFRIQGWAAGAAATSTPRSVLG